MTRQPLVAASLDVYVNHSRTGSAQTGAGGDVLLWMSYSPGLNLTLLGRKPGYVPHPLLWSATRRPSE